MPNRNNNRPSLGVDVAYNDVPELTMTPYTPSSTYDGPTESQEPFYNSIQYTNTGDATLNAIAAIQVAIRWLDSADAYRVLQYVIGGVESNVDR